MFIDLTIKADILPKNINFLTATVKKRNPAIIEPFSKYFFKHNSGIHDFTSLPRRHCEACVTRSFPIPRSWGRNAWRTPKNVCGGGYDFTF